MKELGCAVTALFLIPAILASNALAGTINFSATGDNYQVGGWYVSGGSLVPLSLLGGDPRDWMEVKYGTADLTLGSSYSFIFQVINDDAPFYREKQYWDWNPGGFLGQISDSNGNVIKTSASGWSYAVRQNIPNLNAPSGYDPYIVSSFNRWEWFPVDAYGSNTPGAYYTEHGEHWNLWDFYQHGISGIDPEAQWIWTENNFSEPNAPGAETSVFLRYSVPEPSVLVLLFTGMAFVGLAANRTAGQRASRRLRARPSK